jgi:hypothetical protein
MKQSLILWANESLRVQNNILGRLFSSTNMTLWTHRYATHELKDVGTFEVLSVFSELNGVE